MQFTVYRNTGNVKARPYLLNVQSEIIGKRYTRVVVPLLPLADFDGARADRLTPIITLEDGAKHVVMTHELASIPAKVLGEEVCCVINQRDTIKAALDFLFDGI